MSGIGLASNPSFEQLRQRFDGLSGRLDRSVKDNEKIKKLIEVVAKINPIAARMWQAQCRAVEQTATTH
jgi:hypothetical protein